MNTILDIEGLTVHLDTPGGTVEAVRNISLSLASGEVLALVGESGSGKSILCKSMMGLLPKNGRILSGRIMAQGRNLAELKDSELRKLRGSFFSMIFQDPLNSLDPTLPVGRQIQEAVTAHNRTLPRRQVKERVLELMQLTGIENAEERSRLYPYHFSGGMRQRCVLAIALAGNPKLLLADEPVTALDVTIKAQILDLLKQIRKETGTAMILVSHDLGAVARCADRAAIMYAGKIVETGTVKEIFHEPAHPYTKALLSSLPSLSGTKKTLPVIPGMPPSLIHPPKGDAFACRNKDALAIDYLEEPPMFRVSDTHYAASWLLDPRASKAVLSSRNTVANDSQKPSVLKEPLPEPLLQVRHLTHTFRINRKTSIPALNDVSFTINRREIFGLVGESGSGKSTCAGCVMNIYKPDKGEIFFEGINTLDPLSFRKHKDILNTKRQILFQDSSSSLNQRMKVEKIITEPLLISKKKPMHRSTLREEAAWQLSRVGMDESYLDQYPPSLSGGQRQRVALARALIMSPSLMVADEPIASLDVSIQAQVVNLFRSLQQEEDFSILFIAHDLSMVEFLCDRVGVMAHGRLLEIARTKELFLNPIHPYTQLLLSSIPVPDPLIESNKAPGAPAPPEYDRLAPLREISPGHFAAV